MVGKQSIAHQKKHLHPCRCFFRYRGEWYLQSSAFSHRISDAKRKSDHSQMVATRKHKHESPSPKYKNIWNICSKHTASSRTQYQNKNFYSYLFCGNFRPPLQRKLPTLQLGTALTVPNVCYYLSIRREEQNRKNAKFPYRYKENWHFL